IARAFGDARVGHQLLDAADVRRKEPGVTPAAVAGLQIAGQGYIAAGDLTRTLVAAAMRHGAIFDLGSAVAVEGGAAARLRTADEIIESDAVIIAAGSWSATVEGVKPAPEALKPIRGQLLQLRMPERPASH